MYGTSTVSATESCRLRPITNTAPKEVKGVYISKHSQCSSVSERRRDADMGRKCECGKANASVGLPGAARSDAVWYDGSHDLFGPPNRHIYS